MNLKQEKVFYYLVMGAMSALIVFSAGFAYMGANGYLQKREKGVFDDFSRSEKAGQTKSLPDFVVDTLPSDDLEMLKP